MKNCQCDWIGDGEFVQRLDELRQLHAKCQDFWIVDAAKEFLHLGERGDKDDVGIIKDGGKAVLHQVDGVAA